MKYSRDFIRERLLFKMPTVPTDVGIVFGVRSFSGLVASRAAKLYRENRFSKLIVTGGMPVREVGVTLAFAAAGRWQHVKGALSWDFARSVREADHMYKVLRREGVPEKAIIKLDREAMNTGANVKNIMNVVKAFETATAVTLAPFQRRALGTLRKEISPHLVALTSEAVYPAGIDRHNWHEVWGLERTLNQEMTKIDPANTDLRTSYLLQGFCMDFNVADEADLVRMKSEARVLHDQLQPSQ